MSILFRGNIEEGNYTLIKSTDGWVLKGETSYVGFNSADRPQGEWKEVYAETDYRNGWIEFSCECCGHQHGLESGEYGWSYGEPIPWKFCPLCGARMRGEEE